MEKEYKITIKKFFKHLHRVNEHRFRVFCLCCKLGIPFQGLMHDLSKYSPVEFWEGVKYIDGDYSPIRNCKQVNGYSKAWLHHKGRNKHHYEYWFDYATPVETPPMPFKYFLELICDNMAAGMTYQGKKWTKEYQLTYWNRIKEKVFMDERLKKLLEDIFKEIAEKGIDRVLKKAYLKRLYEEALSTSKVAKKQ